MSFFSSRFSSSFSSSSIFQSLLKFGLLGAAVFSVFYLTSPKKSKTKKITKEELIAILKEIAAEFHTIFSDLAQMTVNVMRSMKAKGLDKSLPQDQLEGMLLQQGFQNRMKTAQQKILDLHFCNSADLQEATSLHANDKEVKKYTEGIESMYKDSVKGLLPLCVDVKMNGNLTKEKLTEILNDIHLLKQKKFRTLFQNLDSTENHCVNLPDAGTIPSPSLSRKLQEANDEAEKEVIQKYEKICPDVKTFQHALALHSRDDDFAKKKSAMDEIHSDIIINIMQQKNSAKVEADTTIIAAIHPKLEETTKEEINYRLESAEELRSLILCLVTQTKQNSLKSLNDFTEAIDRIHIQDCCFVYMNSDEAAKSEISELKKVGENASTECPVYVLFVGKAHKFSSKNIKEIEQHLASLEAKKKETKESKNKDDANKRNEEKDATNKEKQKNDTKEEKKEENKEKKNEEEKDKKTEEKADKKDEKKDDKKNDEAEGKKEEEKIEKKNESATEKKTEKENEEKSKELPESKNEKSGEEGNKGVNDKTKENKKEEKATDEKSNEKTKDVTAGKEENATNEEKKKKETNEKNEEKK